MRKEEQNTHSYFCKSHWRHSHGPERLVNLSITAERKMLERQNAAQDNED